MKARLSNGNIISGEAAKVFVSVGIATEIKEEVAVEQNNTDEGQPVQEVAVEQNIAKVKRVAKPKNNVPVGKRGRKPNKK